MWEKLHKTASRLPGQLGQLAALATVPRLLWNATTVLTR
jgi:hypothetical protein